jgi:DHA3 family tetracycline resistance protein-like MFS transporter
MQDTPGRLDRVGILRPLTVRDFAYLWTGTSISMVGDGIYIVAIALQVIELSNTPTALAAVGIAWSLPQVFLLLASGTLSDRVDRRRLMIAGDAIRFVAIAAVGYLSLVDQLTIPRLIGLVVVYGVGQAIFGPAFTSIVPSIVPEEMLVEANALGLFVRPFAMTLVGPLVGGLLVGRFGTGWAFIADGFTFAFSALMIFLMRVRPVQRDPTETSSMWAETKEGMRYVRERPWLWAALLGALISLLCTWGPWETLVPFIVTNALDGSATDLGLVFGAGGLGAVLAALIIGQRGDLPRKPITVLYLSWAFGMLMTTGFGLVSSVWQAMVVAFFAEGAITVLVVVWITLLQRLVPRELLGRVSSLDWMVSTAGVPISFAIVGPLAGAIGVRATLIWAGILGAAVVIGFLFIPGARDPERDGSLLVESAVGPADEPPGERR